MPEVTVYKGRTNTLLVQLTYDVSQDQYTSQIRKGKSPTSELIATWDISLQTDGTDGTLVLTLDDAYTSDITDHHGYMDIKRVSGGEPMPVFLEPLQVVFRPAITQ